MPNDILPEWEDVLASAAHLQRILPDAVLVGGSASVVYSKHRLSTDADHVLVDLRRRFDQVLADLEVVAGWQTARVRRPVMILGSLDRLYPQPNDESALQQLQIQLAQPLPYDLEDLDLDEYKNLAAHWRNWENVRAACVYSANLIFDQIVGLEK